MRTWKKCVTGIVIAAIAIALYAAFAGQFLKGSAVRAFGNGKLDNADYWSDQPSILSAGYGFDNIVGLPTIDEQTVHAAGGSWFTGATCTSGATPDDGVRTSAAPVSVIPTGYEGYADYDDGLPVVFSWPVASETVDPSDFQFTLNTGAVVYGHAAGMNPNWENSERNTVVLFGDFGNRKKAAEPGAVFPVKLEIVADDTPLHLVGPGGREISAVGMTWTTDTTPYDSGPKLVGAKLDATGTKALGESGATIVEKQGGYLPNDELSLYGERGDFRLRVLTTGGFSPDGVTGLRPDDFEHFFRLQARGENGSTVMIAKEDVDYRVAGATLRVIGLSDLGKAANPDTGISTTTATPRTATTTSTSSSPVMKQRPEPSSTSRSRHWKAATTPSTTPMDPVPSHSPTCATPHPARPTSSPSSWRSTTPCESAGTRRPLIHHFGR